jgi:hypothetical protein
MGMKININYTSRQFPITLLERRAALTITAQ